MTPFFCFFVLSSGAILKEGSFAKRIQNKINKEIIKVFKKENFSLEESNIQLNNNLYLLENSIKEIKIEDKLVGYLFLGKAPSKTDTFDYLVLFDPTFTIKKATVLVYREDYGGEIASKRWLGQFAQKQTSLGFTYGDNISAISGATISVQSMTASMNYVFASLRQMNLSVGQ